jgi:hypothetical protein
VIRGSQAARELGQLLAWSLMLGVLLLVLASAWFGVAP